MQKRVKEKTEENENNAIKALNLCKNARALIHIRKPGQAEPLLLTALDLSPKNPYVLVALGDTKRMQKQFTTAAKYYQRCLEADPLNPFAMSGLGDAYRGSNNLDSAIDIWTQALDAYPENHLVMTRLADALTKKGNLTDARQIYEKAISPLFS